MFKLFSPYYLLSAEVICQKCSTLGIAWTLATHSCVQADDENEFDEPVEDKDTLVIGNGINNVPEKLYEEVEAIYPSLLRDSPKQRLVGVNTCNQCNTPYFGKYEGSEPGSTFFPVTAEEAGILTLRKLAFDSPIKVDGASFDSPDLIFLNAKRPIS